MSAAVSTATTPGVGRDVTPPCRRAGSSARWNGERTMRIDERPVGRLVGTEDVGAADLGQAVDPLTRDDPRPCPPAAATASVSVAPMGGHDRRDDLPVAGAAAQHAPERVHHLLLGRHRRAAQQRGRRRRACPACRCRTARRRARGTRAAGASVSPLACEALEGLDAPALEAPDRRHARGHRFAVQQHGAGAAVARVASHLGGGQAPADRGARRSAGAPTASTWMDDPFTSNVTVLTGRPHSSRAHGAPGSTRHPSR